MRLAGLGCGGSSKGRDVTVNPVTTRLAVHLTKLWKSDEHWAGDRVAQTGDFKQAEAIIADPQTHLEALVEAGVLEECNVFSTESRLGRPARTVSPGYRIPLPPLELCKYCGGEVEPWIFEAGSVSPGRGWRHASNGERQCRTLADPS